MIQGLNNVKVGSILFIGGKTPTSWLIRQFLDFKYSHVAYYLGMGNLLESDVGGVQINPIAHYVDSWWYYGEVINPPLSEAQIAEMTTTMLVHLSEKYDYTLAAGAVLSKLVLRPRKYSALFNRKNAWICSELVAEGLSHAGLKFGLPISQITPRDLYQRLKEDIKHDSRSAGTTRGK